MTGRDLAFRLLAVAVILNSIGVVTLGLAVIVGGRS